MEKSVRKNKFSKILVDSLGWIPIVIAFIFILFIQYHNIKNSLGSESMIDTLTREYFTLREFSSFISFIKETSLYGTFLSYNRILINTSFIAYLLLIPSLLYRLLYKKVLDPLLTLSFFMPLILYILFCFNIMNVSYFSAMYIFMFYIMVLVSLVYILYEFLKEIKGLGKYLLIINFIYKYVFITLFAVFGLMNSTKILKYNLEAKQYSLVNLKDVKAFKWIQENIKDNYYFVSANMSGFEINQNYQYDGLLYLKAFTDKEEALTFVPGDVNFPNKVLREIYLQLAKMPGDKTVLVKLTDYNILYIYEGAYKPWGEGYLNSSDLENYPDLYKLIYNDKAKIYKIELDNNL